MPGSYVNAIWVPGQPSDPTSQVLDPRELSERLLYLENAFTTMKVDDLPLGDLQRSLEQSWAPDTATLLVPGSVTREILATAWVSGTIGAGGTVVAQGAGSPPFTVVRNGAGDYTITFPPYKITPQALGTPRSSVTGFRVPAKTTSTAQFVMSADSDFDFWIVGK